MKKTAPTTHSKMQPPSAPLPAAVPPSDEDNQEMTITLDFQAAAHVRRYLEVTPWNYTASDIISGCVYHGLELAFGNMEEAARMTGLSSLRLHEGEWGFVEEEIRQAHDLLTDGQAPQLKETTQDNSESGCTLLLAHETTDTKWEKLELDPELTAAIGQRAATEGVSFAAAFKELVRDFFARERKEVA